MSKTPRTDALLLEINEGRVYKDEGPLVDLCRSLETELREKDKRIAELEGSLRFIYEECDWEEHPKGGDRRIGIACHKALSKTNPEQKGEG